MGNVDSVVDLVDCQFVFSVGWLVSATSLASCLVLLANFYLSANVIHFSKPLLTAMSFADALPFCGSSGVCGPKSVRAELSAIKADAAKDLNDVVNVTWVIDRLS